MTGRRESLLQSQLLLLSAQAVRLIFGLAITVLLVRRLGDADFGAFVYVSSFLIVTARIVDAGFNSAVAAEVARGERGAALYRAARIVRGRIAVGTALVGLGIVVAQGALPDTSTAVEVALVAALAACIWSCRDRTAFAVFLAHGRNRDAAFMSVALQAVFVAGSIAFILVDPETALLPVLFLLCVRDGLLGPVARIMARRAGIEPVAPAAGVRAAEAPLQSLFPLGVATGLAAVYFHLDVFMLESMRGPADVGTYGVALRLVMPLVTIISLASSPLSPLLAQAAAEGRLREVLPAAAASLLGWTLPAIAFMQLSPEIVLLIEGEPDPVSADALGVLARSGLAVSLGIVFSLALVAARHWWAWAGCAVAGFVVNVVLNALWIPARGVAGAADATLATEITVAVSALAVILVRRRGEGVDLGVVRRGVVGIAVAVVPTLLAAGVFFLVDPASEHRLAAGAALALGAGAVYTFGPWAARVRDVLEPEKSP